MKDEFDIGPLSWVQSEIQFALARADEAIIKFGANPSDQSLIQTTLTNLHQVTGALLIVGLESVTRVSGATEKLVEALGRGDVNPGSENIEMVRGAIKALNRYVEALMRGEPNRPLALFQMYRTLLATVGSEPPNPIDLFYPDLSRTPKFTENASPQTASELAPFLAARRVEFQKGLLLVLRSADFQPGLAAMYGALFKIEQAQPAEAKTLWWIACGFLDGLLRSPAPPGAFQKQLCGRIDLEIKRQAEGTIAVPERLLRELLFAIAYMQPTTARLRAIHDAYRLSSLLPLARQESPESTRVKVLLDDIKQQLERVKETWLHFTTGHRPSLDRFVNEAVQLNNFAQSFGNKGLRAIFAKLVEVGEDLLANPRDPDEALALEVATTMLTATDAIENYAQLGPRFNTMSQTVIVRVAAALRGRPLPETGAVQIVDTRRTTQEKKLFLQLGQEILNHLNRIEEVLDTFFRNPAKHADLATLPEHIKRVHGALVMLESQDAVNLLKAGSDLIQKFSTANDAVDPKDAELTADIFSHLGMFVVAIQQGYDHPDELLQPVLARSS